MAILDVREVFAGRKGGEGSRERRYVRVFDVDTDTFSAGPLEVRFATGIPRIYDPYITSREYDYGALCQDINAEQQTNCPTLWKVTCEYSTQLPEGVAEKLDPERFPPPSPPGGSGSGSPGGMKSHGGPDADRPEENPLRRPSVISWDSQQFQKPITKAIATKIRINDDEPRDFDHEVHGFGKSSTNLIANTAGDKFDPPIEIDDSRPVLVIERNEENYDHKRALEYQDTVNEDAFFGFDPGTAKIQSIKARREFENGVFFWRVTYEVHFRREFWNREILNAGMREAVRTAGLVTNKKQIFDAPPVVFATNPRPLAEDGSALSKTSTDLVYLIFQVYERKKFSDLNLP